MDRKSRERRRQRQLQQQDVSIPQFHYFNNSEENLHRQSSSSNYTRKVGDHVAIAMDHPFGHQGVHVLKNNTLGGATDQNDDIHAEGSLYHRHQPNIAGAHPDHLPSEQNFLRKLSSPSPSSEHPQYPELTTPPPTHQGGYGRKYDLIILSTPLQHMQKQRQKEKKKKLEKEKEKELEKERKMKQPAVPARNDLPNRLAGTPPSPLPRPLNAYRPVIVDSTITSSSKIVASIGDPAKTRSASSPTFETTAGPSKARPRAKTIANNRPQPIQDPLSPKKSKEEGSYIGKEELHRKPPQTILPEGYKPPQFTDAVPVVPGTPETTYEATTGNSDNVVDDGGLMSNELDTAYLVLEPYLPPNHEMPALKKKTPPTPTTSASASTPSTASATTPKPAHVPQGDASNPTTAAVATSPYPPSPTVPAVPSPPPRSRSPSSSSRSSPPTDLPLSSSTLTSSPYQMQTPSDVPFVSLDSPKVPHRHPRIRAISPTLSTLSDASNSSWSTAMTASTATSSATTVSYPGSASGPSYVVTYPGCITAMSDPSYQQQQQQQQQRQQAPLEAHETASTLSLLVSLNAMPSMSSQQKQRQQQNPYTAREVDMDQTSPLSATFYSPATPTSAKTPTSAGPRPLGPKTPPPRHQQRQQRQPKHNYQDTLEEADLSDSGSINRRTNNPQAPGGHGASFSIFNFES